MYSQFLPKGVPMSVRRFSETLRRSLVALTVFVAWYVSPGLVPWPVQGAPRPAGQVEEPVVVLEQQIPEYNLLVSRRRQDAIERSARIRRWAVHAQIPEGSAAHRKRVYREQAIRRERLAGVADLVPRGYRQYVLDVASRFEVDPRLVAAVGTVESKWYPRALGSHGDSGLMQILPSTGDYIARNMGLSEYDLFDPLTNLSMGTWYLQSLLSDYGSRGQALAAYNGGPRGAPLGDEHPYTKRVMHVYRLQGSNPSYGEPFSRGEAH